MATSTIKLEIDKESYEEVKNKLLELRVIAEEVGGEIRRLGCPVCGHDPDHKAINGGDCDLCYGTGQILKLLTNKLQP